MTKEEFKEFIKAMPFGIMVFILFIVLTIITEYTN